MSAKLSNKCRPHVLEGCRSAGGGGFAKIGSLYVCKSPE